MYDLLPIIITCIFGDVIKSRIMKKIALLMTMLPMLASAFTGDVQVDGINYFINTDEQTSEVINKDGGYTGEIIIPSSINYDGVACKVTKIGFNAFKGCSELSSITLPNSVTEISVCAFEGCTGLSSVTIPESVKDISIASFKGCSSLTSVVIPSSVTGISVAAFRDCTSLSVIIIPDSLQEIAISSFRGCSGLSSVTIPDCVTEIYDDAFKGCKELRSLTIPRSVTNIYSGAFADCENIKDVYCWAERVPDTPLTEGRNTPIFSSSCIENATLHVPAESIEIFRNTAPWSGFKEIVALD